MNGARRPGNRTEQPCQDVLTAFLAKYRITGLFYHCLLAQHLTRNGFEVCHLVREDNHADVWVLSLRRGQVSVGCEIEWTKHQVCLFLETPRVALSQKGGRGHGPGQPHQSRFQLEPRAAGPAEC